MSARYRFMPKGGLSLAVARTAIELAIGLPLLLVLARQTDTFGKLGLFAAAALSFAAGWLLFGLPPVRRRLSLAVAIIGIAALCWALQSVALAGCFVFLWRGRYPALSYLHYLFAVGLNAAGILVASNLASASQYRLLFIVSALVWVGVWLLSLNLALLREAGLRQNIVTRSVRLSVRNYAIAFLAVGLLAYLLTIGFGERLLHPRPIDVNMDWMDDAPPETAPAQEQQNPFMPEPGKNNPIMTAIWNILSYIVIGAAAIGLLLAIRYAWKNKEWTWRSLLAAFKRWFLRDNRTDSLPYVEEVRSLQREKAKGRSLWGALFQKNKRADWSDLGDTEKVRRLYEEAVLKGIERGYEFRADRTASETLADIERWQASAPGTDKEAEYWGWLRHARKALTSLYEKAKYGPRPPDGEEVESLVGRYPRGGGADRKSNR